MSLRPLVPPLFCIDLVQLGSCIFKVCLSKPFLKHVGTYRIEIAIYCRAEIVCIEVLLDPSVSPAVSLADFLVDFRRNRNTCHFVQVLINLFLSQAN